VLRFADGSLRITSRIQAPQSRSGIARSLVPKGTSLVDELSASGAEVASKLAERGAPEDKIRQTIQALGVAVIPCDQAIAYQIGELGGSTKKLGLSLGDRACLATALQLNLRAITADSRWKTLRVGARIQVIC
jgi:PIN domain nuclease of toxin-antitoxin system